MNKEIITPDIASAILSKLREAAQASIFEGNTQKPFAIQTLVIDLSVARDVANPFKVSFPFKSVYVQDATDNNVIIQMQPNTNDSFQSTLQLKKNDSLMLGDPIASAFLSWSAQSGKTITLQFFVNAEFRSGSQISVNSGGVSINDGSSASQSVTTLLAATATQILATDTTRKHAMIQNNTGGDLYFGPTSTLSDSGTSKGLWVSAGGFFQWRNTAALYAYSPLGGDITTLGEF